MMKKGKFFGGLRVKESTFDNLYKALSLYNKVQLSPLSIIQFRILAYELLSQLILQDKLKELDISMPDD